MRQARISISTLRCLLRDAFTASDLRRFCRDRPTFEFVLSYFPEGASLEQMIDVVIEQSQKQASLRELLMEIEQYNPGQYRRHVLELFLETFDERSEDLPPASSTPSDSTLGRGSVSSPPITLQTVSDEGVEVLRHFFDVRKLFGSLFSVQSQREEAVRDLGRGAILQLIPVNGSEIVARTETGLVLIELPSLKLSWELNVLARCATVHSRMSLLAVADETQISVWDISSQCRVGAPCLHDGSVSGMLFAPETCSVALLSDEGIRLHHVPSWQLVRRFTYPDSYDAEEGTVVIVRLPSSPGPANALSAARTVSFSPNEKWLASASGCGVVLWRLADAKVQRWLPGDTCGVSSMSFSPDSALLAVGLANGKILVEQIANGEVLHSLNKHKAPVASLCFSAGGARLVSGSSTWVSVYHGDVRMTSDDTVRLWEVATGRLLRTFTGHSGPISGVAFVLGDQGLVTAGSDGTLRLWRLQCPR